MIPTQIFYGADGRELARHEGFIDRERDPGAVEGRSASSCEADVGEILTAFGNAFSARAVLVAAPAAFVWGVLSVALSPCHLSSVPLVVAYMSGGAELPTGRRALAISSAFAVGILASIAVIGAVTAAAGRMLGDVGRAGNWTLAAVFFVVRAEPPRRAPAALVRLRRRPRRAAAARSGRSLLGLVFGAALGPCTFAFMAPLLGLVLHAGEDGAAAYGVLLVALYGLGHAGAIAFAGASLQSVQRWLGWKAGARAVELLRGRRRRRRALRRRVLRLDGAVSREDLPMPLPVDRRFRRPRRPCCAKPAAPAASARTLAAGASAGPSRSSRPVSPRGRPPTSRSSRSREWLTFRVLGLAAESHLGQSVAFFLYDAPKVLLLLVLIVFVVGIVRSFFTAERTRALLAGKARVGRATCSRRCSASSRRSAPARRCRCSSASSRSGSRSA